MECSFDPTQEVASTDPKTYDSSLNPLSRYFFRNQVLMSSRLDALESQMSTVHAKLDGVVLLLEQLNSQRSAAGSAGQLMSSAAPATGEEVVTEEQSALLRSFVRLINQPPTSDIQPQPGISAPTLSNGTSELHESDEDDPLDDAVHGRSLRTLTHREEAARLRMEGHQELSAEVADPGTIESVSSTGTRGKRIREESGRTERLVKRKGDLSRAFLDPVQQGVVSESDGRGLFNS